ncbi:NAD(P)H-dependent oxidoreductase [Aureivirga sp. CE67]|uniref:NAD(P)H-dependent oxidoreductase n=1 Tax=Aureivirga sp. CE67 TaxID=1788983 RepID=UPI0018C9F73F|nr:NAD(P)H-dependent oxidoreductase [Aureivirga sp. CE67]
MHIIESLQWRYATKKFDATKKLTSEQIEVLKNAFSLTATSFGLQPIKLVVIENKEIRESLVEHSFNQRQVADASHLLVICIQDDFTTEDIEKYFSLVKDVRQTPDEILNPFKDYLVDTFSSKTKEDMHTSFKNQAYIALGNLLNVCAVEKIDSCPMEGFNPEKYDEVLDLKSHNLKSALILPVGHRAEDDFMKDLKKVRKPLDKSIIEIK